MIHLVLDRQPRVTLCARATAAVAGVIPVDDLSHFSGDLCTQCKQNYDAKLYCEHGHVWPEDWENGDSCQCGQLHIEERPNGTIWVGTHEESLEAAHAAAVREE